MEDMREMESQETPEEQDAAGFGGKIEKVNLGVKMRESYLDYSMSVIAARALPDVRDGLKPVQRRILWSMDELGAKPGTPYRKVARIVGDTMGKYHPHGDSSIEDALVNMAQDWKMGDVLVDGHGNFGSVDGDEAAAARYIEARMSKASMEMLQDINKNTVDFVPNFDETEKEPSVLPAGFPNLLVNGTTGIAVGMATNIPPHNLGETCRAAAFLIDAEIAGKEVTFEDLISVIPGPDFPTGGQILGIDGIRSAYMTGQGKIRIRGISEIKPCGSGKQRIEITEIPYGVNKKTLVEDIASLAKAGKLEGVADVNDYSSREGMLICVDLKKGVNANVILNRLYHHTGLQSTFSVNMLCLVPGANGALEPKCLSLESVLREYLSHRKEVVRRRTEYDREKAESRAHIVEGLIAAIDKIDLAVKCIREAESPAEAKKELCSILQIDDIQASAILDMRLRALTSLESGKLEDELAGLCDRISVFAKILSDPTELLLTVKKELLEVAQKYGKDRKTEFVDDFGEVCDEDLIPNEDVVIIRTHLGYMKRLSVDAFSQQKRGGRGSQSIKPVQDDYVTDVFTMKTHGTLLFITNFGRLYALRGYEIPQVSRTARGTAVVNLIRLQADETVAAVIPVPDMSADGFVYMATAYGLIKKSNLSLFRSVRRSGVTAINLQEGDRLVSACVNETDANIMFVTKKGISVKFDSSTIRAIGRAAKGVRAIRLHKGDEVVSMQIEYAEGLHLLVMSQYGYGKITPLEDYHTINRGGAGVKSYRMDKNSGNVIAAKIVSKDDVLLVAATDGKLIRFSCREVIETKRVARGSRLIRLPDGVEAADVSKVWFGDDEEMETAATEE